MKRAIFLDRDGVINVDRGYVSTIEAFEFVPHLFETLRHFRALGYLLIIVTNQSGIGRGYYTLEDFKKLSAWMLERLEEEGIKIDALYHCPHDPDSGCGCRKPAPGMILEAIDTFGIDPQRSWMIGDKQSDIDAAKNAGIERTILIAPDCADKRGARYCVQSIFDTMKIITT